MVLNQSKLTLLLVCQSIVACIFLSTISCSPPPARRAPSVITTFSEQVFEELQKTNDSSVNLQLHTFSYQLAEIDKLSNEIRSELILSELFQGSKINSITKNRVYFNDFDIPYETYDNYIDILSFEKAISIKLNNNIAINLIENYNSQNNLYKISGIPVRLIDTRTISFWNEDNIIGYFIDESSFPKNELSHFKEQLAEVVSEFNHYTNLKIRPINSSAYQQNPFNNLLIQYKSMIDVSMFSCANPNGTFARATIGHIQDVPSEIKIFSTFFNQATFSKKGIIRHEFGHILGFMHTCLYSNSNNCAQTEILHYGLYGDNSIDPDSFMKDLKQACNSNDFELNFSDQDIVYLKEIYRR